MAKIVLAHTLLDDPDEAHTACKLLSEFLLEYPDVATVSDEAALLLDDLECPSSQASPTRPP